MLHKILLLIGILTFTGANSQIRESYEPNFSKFKLTDFGFHGKVKNITTSFEKKDENGDFKPSAWKTIKIYHNFDENGNLISEFGINHDLDTCEITYYTYNNKNLISSVKNYSTGYWGEFNTHDLRNWDLKEANFEYDEIGNRVKETISMQHLTHVTLNEFNSNGQIVKSVRLDNTSETNSTLDKTEYMYDSKGKLSKLIVKNENQPHLSGETTFTYVNDVIVSETFLHLDGALGSRTIHEKGKVDIYFGNDTLTNYTKSIYNEKGELIISSNHYDGDGVFKSKTKFTYSYDLQNNLIEENSITQHEIMHSRETNQYDIYRTNYAITYY